MDAHVSWRAVLQRIDESGIAEDKSILAAAGEQGAWVVYQSSGEFPMTSTGEFQSNRLMLGM